MQSKLSTIEVARFERTHGYNLVLTNLEMSLDGAPNWGENKTVEITIKHLIINKIHKRHENSGHWPCLISLKYGPRTLKLTKNTCKCLPLANRNILHFETDRERLDT